MPSSGKLVSIPTKPSEPVRTIYITSNKAFVLGRDIDRADYVFVDQSISGVHCTLETQLAEDGKEFIVNVRDSSRNGTFVDSVAVDVRGSQLPSGSVLKLGTFRFNFHGFTPRSLEAYLEPGKVLGRGAYGLVHEAKRQDGPGSFAVKYLPVSDKEYVMREVQVMKDLNHENIVHFFGTLRNQEDVCLIMELAPLGSLQRLIEASVLPEEQAAPAAGQICAALSYLHGMRIMHRDIKPGNILVFQERPALIVKVADFGLARVLNGNSVHQSLCGTPIYMAPEVVMSGGAGSPHYGFKSDSWSFGVVIYAMLAGRAPYNRRDVDVYAPRDNRRPSFTTLPEGTTAGAVDVLGKLIVRNPKCRASATQIASHPWFSRQTNADATEQCVERLLYESIKTHPSYVGSSDV